MRISIIAAALLGTLLVANSNAEPWRLSEATGAPGWLSIDGSYRVRYEHLDNPFRLAAVESDEILVERLLLNMRINGRVFYSGVELQDFRAQLMDPRLPLGTDDVNALEPLRAYAGLRLTDALSDGDQLDLVGGRITIDAGSRRLVARNRFRNTLNAFSGIRANWTGANGTTWQLFHARPVIRLPASLERLADNDAELDEDRGNVRFWGVYGAYKRPLSRVSGDLYWIGLQEDDSASLPTANRDIHTPGLRLYATPAPGHWDFEIEVGYQFGTSRQTLLPGDTEDLDHRAGFAHVHVARSFEGKWSPRAVFQYDYASGDRTPDDGDNNRFDTLYGARRFDFGPTGIYGAFARSNISSPGLRIDTRPGESTDFRVGYRAVWLASRKDALVTAGLRDPVGESGNFVGHQLEFLVGHEAIPGNLDIEFGGAWIIDGEFLRDAPGAPATGDSFYWYAHAELTF